MGEAQISNFLPVRRPLTDAKTCEVANVNNLMQKNGLSALD